jgi:hypothetical protein
MYSPLKPVLFATIACACTAATSAASQPPPKPTTSPAPRFVIPTNGRIGFQDGKAFYAVRMSADAFRQRFGEPDQKMLAADGRTVAYYNYFAVGLQVAIRRGECWYYTFHTVAVTYPRSGQVWKAGNIATDSGIHAGMSFQEATRITPPSEILDSGNNQAALYRWGGIYWEKGQLNGFTITDIARNRREGKPSVR